VERGAVGPEPPGPQGACRVLGGIESRLPFLQKSAEQFPDLIEGRVALQGQEPSILGHEHEQRQRDVDGPPDLKRMRADLRAEFSAELREEPAGQACSAAAVLLVEKQADG
jgi:hypothetical protein